MVTGNASSAVLSMVLTVAFVLWSSIRGVANTAYLKDVLVIIALVVLIVAVPMLYGGGIGVVFTLQAHDPTALIVHAGLYDNLW